MPSVPGIKISVMIKSGTISKPCCNPYDPLSASSISYSFFRRCQKNSPGSLFLVTIGLGYTLHRQSLRVVNFFMLIKHKGNRRINGHFIWFEVCISQRQFYPEYASLPLFTADGNFTIVPLYQLCWQGRPRQEPFWFSNSPLIKRFKSIFYHVF